LESEELRAHILNLVKDFSLTHHAPKKFEPGKTYIPPTEKYILLGMGFKDDTDDTRESPSLELFTALDLIAPEGFWYDQYVKELPNFGMLKTASQEIIDHAKYFILMHHSDFYRELLRKRATEMNSKDHLTVFALRYQNPILGIKWVYPRSQLNVGEKNG
jgi:UDP-N-acetyl-D-mannosaminuronate dehydrogenase